VGGGGGRPHRTPATRARSQAQVPQDVGAREQALAQIWGLEEPPTPRDSPPQGPRKERDFPPARAPGERQTL